MAINPANTRAGRRSLYVSTTVYARTQACAFFHRISLRELVDAVLADHPHVAAIADTLAAVKQISREQQRQNAPPGSGRPTLPGQRQLFGAE